MEAAVAVWQSWEEAKRSAVELAGFDVGYEAMFVRDDEVVEFATC